MQNNNNNNNKSSKVKLILPGCCKKKCIAIGKIKITLKRRVSKISTII